MKENGKWKIWHLGMYYDFTPGFPESMTAQLGKGTATAQGGGQAGGPPQGGAPIPEAPFFGSPREIEAVLAIQRHDSRGICPNSPKPARALDERSAARRGFT